MYVCNTVWDFEALHGEVSMQFAVKSGPSFMALLTAEFCAFDHDSPFTCMR